MSTESSHSTEVNGDRAPKRRGCCCRFCVVYRRNKLSTLRRSALMAGVWGARKGAWVGTGMGWCDHWLLATPIVPLRVAWSRLRDVCLCRLFAVVVSFRRQLMVSLLPLLLLLQLQHLLCRAHKSFASSSCAHRCFSFVVSLDLNSSVCRCPTQTNCLVIERLFWLLRSAYTRITPDDETGLIDCQLSVPTHNVKLYEDFLMMYGCLNYVQGIR